MNRSLLGLGACILALISATPSWGGRELAQYRTGWIADSTAILFVKSKGVITREMSFVDKKVASLAGGNAGTSEEILRIVGDVSFNGKYAWLDERQLSPNKAIHKFHYFGPSGEEIWGKDNFYGGAISQDGERVLATEVELRWLERNEHANSPHPVGLFDSAGKRIQAYSDCKSYASSFRKIPNTRFTAIQCAASAVNKTGYTLVIDLSSGKAKRIETQAGIEVGDDGTYVLYLSEQVFEPDTKLYGDQIRTKFRSGSFFE